MIINTGNDVVSVKNMEESILSYDWYLPWLFRPSEQAYCAQYANRYQQYAGIYSVKGAVMQALEIDWHSSVKWTEIEVTHTSAGEPEVLLHDGVKKFATALQVKTIHVSLSQTEQYAASVVTLER